MLGDSGVGKTTYMITTYGVMQQSIAGFNLVSNDNSIHNRLANLFSSLTSKNRYPAATDKYSEYKFSFIHDDDSVMEFRWIDFKGGVINYDDENNRELKKLKNALNNADAVLLFVESDKLLNGTLDQGELTTLLYYLFQYASADYKKLTIMPLFTKFDKVINLGMSEDDYLKLKEPFMQLEEMAKNNENLSVYTVPIACSPKCMMHLDFAILLLMREGIEIHYLDDAKKIEKEYDEAMKLWNEGSLLADIFGLSDKRNSARTKLSNAKDKYEKLNKMEGAYNKINEFIEEYEMFEYYSIKENGFEDIFDL
jgi:hypothetical protein